MVSNILRKKKWIYSFCLIFVILISLCMLVTYALDPWFHFHKPLKNWYYSLDCGERYQNDGILRNFDYDAVIIGSSMVDNFKTSQMNALLNCNSVKVPNAGSTYHENTMELQRSLSTHDVKYVIRSIDYRAVMIRDKNSYRIENGSYPMYLYNDNLLDDIHYLLNGDMLVNHILPMVVNQLEGHEPGILSFDEYDSLDKECGQEAVLGEKTSWNVPSEIYHLSDNDEKMVCENVRQNFIDFALAYPDTQFYCFFPPYSAAYYGQRYEEGNLDKYFEMEYAAVNELVNNKPENLHLFWWNDHFDLTGNLNHYSDSIHYDAQTNSQMLAWMKNARGEITEENYQNLLEKEYQYYHQFDFDSLFH